MDFSLLFANKILFATLVLAAIGWLVAFIGQAAAESDNDTPLGRVWFGIFVQLFVILGVAVTLASDSIGMVRLQLSAWIVVALILAVLGIDEGIYSPISSYEAMAAGYFILTIVNIIWLFFFTSEEGSPIFNLFHSWGGGGQLSGGGGMGFGGGRKGRGATGVRGGPGGMRMGNNSNSANGSAFGGGYGGSGGAAYQPAYGQSPSTADVTSGNKAQRNGAGSHAGSDMGGAHSVARSASQHRNITPQHSSAGLATGGGAAGAAGGDGASSPSHYTTNAPSVGAADPLPGYGYKARALYAYSANPDDPTEIGFAKGEILNIVDNSGKWWQAKKDTGETGIVPSNYMQLL